MLASVTILGETVPDRFVWFMAIILILLGIESWIWLRPRKTDDKEEL